MLRGKVLRRGRRRRRGGIWRSNDRGGQAARRWRRRGQRRRLKLSLLLLLHNMLLPSCVDALLERGEGRVVPGRLVGHSVEIVRAPAVRVDEFLQL